MTLKGFHGFLLSVNELVLRLVIQISPWPGGVPALIRRSVVLNVSATIVDLPRLDIQMQTASVMDMVTEFSTSEPEDMEFSAQQQAMRFYVDLETIWVVFVSRRPLPREDEESATFQLYSVAERLNNVFQKHSAETFPQINDRMEGVGSVTLSDEVVG